MIKNLKKTLSLFFLFVLIHHSVFSQKCATTYRDSIALSSNPDYLEIRKQRLAKILNSDSKSAKVQHALVYIPTVVHVIHTSEAGIISDDPNIGNISVEQIMSQIEVLNEDYRRKAGTPGFNDLLIGADLEIQFCLAKLDPNGFPTDGITRHYSPKLQYDPSGDDREIKEIVHWPADQYLNIYLVPKLKNNFLGYASFPEEPREYDGVVMANQFFGDRIGTASDVFSFPYNRGRTMTHEVGHWLGLVHIWGDGGCGIDDGCDDTPLSDSGNFGCDTTHISCATPDMVRNYMDYSDDDCFNIFTQCQKSVARSVFDANFPSNRSDFFLNSITGIINCSSGIDTTATDDFSDLRIGTFDQDNGQYIIYNLSPGQYYELTVLNFQGQIVQRQNLIANSFGDLPFKLNNTRSGIYILQLRFQNGDTKRFKLYGPLK